MPHLVTPDQRLKLELVRQILQNPYIRQQLNPVTTLAVLSVCFTFLPSSYQVKEMRQRSPPSHLVGLSWMLCCVPNLCRDILIIEAPSLPDKQVLQLVELFQQRERELF